MFKSKEVIASIHNENTLRLALELPEIHTLFLMTGDILNLKTMVEQVHQANKRVFIHVDFVHGLSTDAKGIQYMARMIEPDGIISTRGQVIQLANRVELLTVQRLFLIDSNALASGLKSVLASMPDAVEAMPGLMPRVIRELVCSLHVPIVSGGLFKTKSDLCEAFKAGAQAVSTSSPNLWSKVTQLHNGKVS